MELKLRAHAAALQTLASASFAFPGYPHCAAFAQVEHQEADPDIHEDVQLG